MIPVFSEDSTSSDTSSSARRALQTKKSVIINPKSIGNLRLNTLKKRQADSRELICPVVLRFTNVSRCRCCRQMIQENLRLRRKDAWDDPCTFNFMVPPILEMSVLYRDLTSLDKSYLESF